MPSATPKQSLPDGYAIGYGRDKGAFRVYIMGLAAAVFLTAKLIGGSNIALAFAIPAAAVAFYFYPLTEKAKARLGANQYGIFVDGLGIIAWRAVYTLELQTIAFRTIEHTELHIKLSQPLRRALIADWRRVSYLRLLMKLPWSMTHDNTIRINLEPFAGTPDATHGNLMRLWRHYR